MEASESILNTWKSSISQKRLIQHLIIGSRPLFPTISNQFLPPNTDSFKVVGVQYQETKFDLEFTEGEMTITCTLNGQTSLVLEFADGLVIDFPCSKSDKKHQR